MKMFLSNPSTIPFRIFFQELRKIAVNKINDLLQKEVECLFKKLQDVQWKEGRKKRG